MIRTLSRFRINSPRKSVFTLQNTERAFATATAPAATGARNEEQEALESWSAARPYADIPGPRPLPLVGNALRFLPGGDWHGLGPVEMQEALFSRFGPLVRLSGLPGRGDMLFLFDPEDVCKVFRTEGHMPIRDAAREVYYYRTKVRPEYFGEAGGALVAQGEEWYNFRTKVNKLMLQPKSVQRYVEPVDEVAEDFLEIISELRDEKKELPHDFQDELFKWGLEGAVAIALDVRLGCLAADAPRDSEAQRMIAATQRIFSSMSTFQLMPLLWRVGRVSPLWRQYISDFDFMMETAWKYTRRTLANLEAQGAEDRDREPSVLVRLLKEESPTVAAVLASDILTGGAETTARSMATTLTNLARYPREQSALAEELRRELPGARPRITTQSLARLPRLRAFLRESMRLTPTVPSVPRTTSQNLVLSGYQVPKGTEILACQLVMSRQDSNVPRAREFLPERWLKGESHESKGHTFASLPFGFGPRMCIGRRFAELELQVLTAKLVHRYIVEYHYGEMPFDGATTYGPSAPLKFRLIERDL
ncbi:hypothetical protein R5R35_011527 [Gryllus longicercus]|uniref:Cytochrome P450 n=1 Tax=Gryllus longicercus TaxID=2509291 RepID=A0AAN9VE12_9ORTH